MSRARNKGTEFETACVKYLRANLELDDIERRAMSGVNDRGDILIPSLNGKVGIVECKNYRQYGKRELDKWKGQTVAERTNAGADFAVLIAHEPGCGPKSFGRNSAYMQLRDLDAMTERVRVGDSARELWVRMTLGDLIKLVIGDVNEQEKN